MRIKKPWQVKPTWLEWSYRSPSHKADPVGDLWCHTFKSDNEVVQTIPDTSTQVKAHEDIAKEAGSSHDGVFKHIRLKWIGKNCVQTTQKKSNKAR